MEEDKSYKWKLNLGKAPVRTASIGSIIMMVVDTVVSILVDALLLLWKKIKLQGSLVDLNC